MKEKIVFILPSLAVGGAERNLIRIANNLFDQGVNIHFLVISGGSDNGEHLNPDIPLTFLNKKRVSTSILALYSFLQASKPTTLLSTLTHLNIVVMIVRGFLVRPPKIILRVECVLSQMIADESLNHTIFSIYPFFIKRFFKKADKLIAISKGVKHDLNTNFKVPLSKIEIIYNPAIPDNIGEYLKGLIEEALLEKKRNYQLIFGVGRLTRQKGFDTLIRAFHHLNDTRTQLVIIGEGSERKNLEKLISDLNCEDRVFLIGEVSNPFKYMKLADVFVMSSRYEGFGNVLVEALASGAEAVATDCLSGPSEILNSGKYGRLVPIDDHELMSDAIKEALYGKSLKPPSDWLSRFRVGTISQEYSELICNV